MTEKVRKEIMMKFLRTLVWIDDEIRPDKVDGMGDPFRSFFFPTAQEFQKKELMVHLHPYDPDTSSDGGNIFDEDPESLVSSMTLAKKADVIILDWHLGRDDPKNSIQILKSLENESAVRYIIVLSKFAERFPKELRDEKMLASNSSKSIEPHVFRKSGDAWANSQGTHIIVMKKPDLRSYSASEFSSSVIKAIYDLMSNATPDHLQWAAIEIAAKLRISIPGWIKSIPSGTDAAVLSELSSDKTEARDFIPEHLLEDLSYASKLHLLASLDSENCIPAHWKSKPYDLQPVSANSERYKKFVHFALPSSKLEKKDVDSIRGKLAEDEPTKLFLDSQQSFAEFCENISSTLEPFPTFGSVYIQEKTRRRSKLEINAENSENNTIYICLSQECDALRCSNLMLLEGDITHSSSGREGVTKLSLLGKAFGFLPEAKSLQPVAVENSGNQRRLKGFKKIGQLRKATARRILNRYWNHLSRSAVNLSRFTLKDREGE